jgi:ABC-type uncharacterized transport system substrate-binding protein
VRRREFIGLLGGATAWSLVTRAQQPGKVHHIGYLTSSSTGTRGTFVDAFLAGLRELRWVEGQNIIIDYRFAEGRFDRLPDLAAELARLNVDIILAAPTPAAVAAKNATATIPIVMSAVGDPIGLGLIKSLARQGGNITGLTYSVGVDTFGKQLELLKETVPKIGRLAVLSNPANPAQSLAITNVKVAAQSLGVQLQLLEARGPDEFNGAFAELSKERVGALLVLADAVFLLQRTRLAAFSHTTFAQ